MAGAWTTDDILTAVKAEYVHPTGSDITDAQLLTILREEMFSILVPLINNTRGAYFETVYDVATTTATSYAIPPRAIGSRLVNLAALDPGGNEYLLPIVDFSDYSAQRYTSGVNSAVPVAYIRNNKVVLNPALPENYTLRMIFYLRPGDLISTTDARLITAKDSTSITLATALGTVTTGALFDVVTNNPPFPYAMYNTTATSVAGNVISGITVSDDVAVGDYVCPAGQSPIPQVPYELHPVLMQLTASRVVGRLGDQKGKALLQEAANEMLKNMIENLKPRIANQPQRIVNLESPVASYGSWGFYGGRWDV